MAEQSDSNKIRAAELLGKSVGLFRDVVETSESKSSDELLSDLEAMLEQVADDMSEATHDSTDLDAFPDDSDDDADVIH